METKNASPCHSCCKLTGFLMAEKLYEEVEKFIQSTNSAYPMMTATISLAELEMSRAVLAI